MKRKHRIKTTSLSKLMGSILLAAMVGTMALPMRRLEAQERSAFVHQRHVSVTGPDGLSQRALVTIPRRPDRKLQPPGERYPMVVALHGQTEAAAGPQRGYAAWNRDYLLTVAFGALRGGRLTPRDYRGKVRQDHLRYVNSLLGARPFEGVVVVTPYTPDLMHAGDDAIASWGDWVAGPFLEQIREEFPGVARARAGTGIDGVSLGGMLALEVGFRHKEAFGAIGAIQPAIDGRVEALVARAAPATEEEVQEIRLLTSDEDTYLASTRALSAALREAGISHRLIEMPGPHGVSFNRGPGSIELLRFADEVLAHEVVLP